jgi:hypothetical protein
MMQCVRENPPPMTADESVWRTCSLHSTKASAVMLIVTPGNLSFIALSL